MKLLSFLSKKDALRGRLYFNWQTDEAFDWESPKPIPTGRPPFYRWFGLFIALVCLLVPAIIWQLLERADEGEAGVEAEILATHQFVQQTAVSGDVELFRSLLSGRDPAWTATQEKLVAAELLFAPQTIDISPIADESTDLQIHFSPDLTAAELTFLQRYSAWLPNDGASQIVLKQTAVYRLGQTGSWLFSPPPADFWGEMRQVGTPQIGLTFPARDAELATRLLTDISRKLAVFCAEGLPCDESLAVQFSTDPTALLALAEPEKMLSNVDPVVLPTPTLLGLPTDTESYDALLTAYSALVSQATLVKATGYRCCRNAHFARAMVDWQLTNWSLRGWPMTPEAYQTLLLDGFQPERASTLWQMPAAETAVSAEIYAFVDFLAEEMPAHQLLALLAQEERYTVWLEKVIGAENLLSALDEQWLQFVFEQTHSAKLGIPTTFLPEQQLRFACTTRTNATVLLAYDPEQDTLSQIFQSSASPRATTLLTPLADGRRFVLEERSSSVDQSDRITLWQDEAAVTLLESRSEGVAVAREWFFLGAADEANGRYLQLGYFDRTAATYSFFVVDSADCSQEACSRLPLAGKPLWSPSGEALILYPFSGDNQRTDAAIWLSDQAGQTRRQIGLGFSPFWLSDDLLAYLRKEPQGDEALWVWSITQNEASKILTSEQLNSFLPSNQPQSIIQFGEFAAHPLEPNRLAFVVLVMNNGILAWHLFSFEIGQSLQQLDVYDTAVQIDFSPQGEWLVVELMDKNLRQTELWQGNQLVQTFWQNGARPDGIGVRWSPNGEWLFHGRERYGLLYAPAEEYVHLLPIDLSRCYEAVWTNGR